MLEHVLETATKLYSLLWQSYRNPSFLYYHSKLIQSQTGVQQGDPLGPMLFSLTLQPIISKLQSSLALFYLDDGTLCGHPDTVLSDFRQIIDECRHIGLSINPSKCELTSVQR